MKYLTNPKSDPNPNLTSYSLLLYEPKSNMTPKIKTLKQTLTLEKQATAYKATLIG